jgi:hypothetical protein
MRRVTGSRPLDRTHVVVVELVDPGLAVVVEHEDRGDHGADGGEAQDSIGAQNHFTGF